MPARRLLSDLAHAVRTFTEVDDEGFVEAWSRWIVFRLDQPAGAAVWTGLPCEARPPRAFHLWTRREGDQRVFELLWAMDGVQEDSWPVVEINEAGDAQVIANNAQDYLDALLYTGGLLGGGTDEDLENARADASAEAVRLGDDIAEELDREEVELEPMGERWEEAQERFADAWFEAVESGD